MRNSKLTAIAVSATLAVSTLLGATSAAAAAGPTSPTQTMVNTATAPSCVKIISQRGSGWFHRPYVKIRNDCRTTKRVKIVWAWGADSPCKSLAPGKTYKDYAGNGSRFDGIKKC